MTGTQKIWLFAALLLVVVLLTVLFASGALRFGLSGPSIYVLYLLAGMLVAMLTFGLLTSSGQLQAKRGGGKLTLGGSIVALVVVAGGGGLYERYLHRPETFDLLVTYWQNDPNALEPLRGQVTIYAGNNDYTQSLDGSGRNRFLALPSRLLGEKATLTLNAPGFTVVEVRPDVFTRDEPVRVKVHRAATFSVPAAEQLTIEMHSAQVVDYGPRPDQRIITVGLKFHCTADLPVPLEKVARLAIFTESGAPLWHVDMKVERAFVVVQPGLTDEYFEALVDRRDLDALAGGRLAKIEVKYEPSVTPHQTVSYASGLFPISLESFEDLSKPSN